MNFSQTLPNSFAITSDDKEYCKKAIEYRNSMKPPFQSNFRVVTIMTYEEIPESMTSFEELKQNPQKLKYIIGCNAEPATMEGKQYFSKIQKKTLK